MPRDRAAGLKAAAVNRKKYGPDYYKRIGAEGGKARVAKGVSDPAVRKRAVEGLQRYFAARRAAKEAATHEETSKEQS